MNLQSIGYTWLPNEFEICPNGEELRKSGKRDPYERHVINIHMTIETTNYLLHLQSMYNDFIKKIGYIVYIS